MLFWHNDFWEQVSGIYSGAARTLSMRACFPSIFNMEQTHGSLTAAVLHEMRQSISNKLFRAAVKPVTPADAAFAADLIPESEFVRSMRQVPMYSFRNGLQTLTDAMVESLRQSSSAAASVDLRLNTSVTRLKRPAHADTAAVASSTGERPQPNASRGSHAVAAVLNGQEEVFDHVICTAPSDVTADQLCSSLVRDEPSALTSATEGAAGTKSRAQRDREIAFQTLQQELRDIPYGKNH